MSANGFSEKCVYFLAGGCIGAAIALLFAPKTGEETRELLGGKAKQGAEVLGGKARQSAELLEKKGSFIRLVSLLGEERTIEARVKSLSLVDHKIILEPIAKS